jgi:hypothetical protein
LRNVATKKEQQDHQNYKDNTPQGKLATLAGHSIFIAAKKMKDERRKRNRGSVI